MEESPARILQAVQKDDIKLFSYLTEQKKSYLSLCFGRFPLLSICYLYGAKKIIAAYEKLLLQTKVYGYIEEDFLTYKKFAAKAGTCMRLYTTASGEAKTIEDKTAARMRFVTDKRVIAPLEMLAVLGDTYRLTTLYSSAPKDGMTDANICRIYTTLHSRKPTIKDGRLHISRNKLTPAFRLAVVTIIIFSLLMIALPASAFSGVKVIMGDGSADNPFKIASEKQLLTAFDKEDAYFKLTKDINLTASWQPADFLGHLDGGGHTLFLADKANLGFIKTLSGSITNLNIRFGELEYSVSENLGLFAAKIAGSASNINLSVTAAFSESVDKELYISCFTIENTGAISDCTIQANINFTGNAQNNSFITGLAAYNLGTISGCTIAEESQIITDSADVSGLVTENGESGTITACKNYAVITQSSKSEDWLPNSAGIVLINAGKVSDCYNHGGVTSISDTQTKTLELYTGGVVCINNGEVKDCFNYGRISSVSHNFTSYAGGIACINNKSIYRCKNDAYINASSVNINVYGGGVAALNNVNTASIISSCSYGNVSLAVQSEDYHSFGGGVLAFNAGTVKDSYSCMSYTAGSVQNVNVYHMGGIAGTSFYGVSQNNFYLTRVNIQYGTATTLTQSILGSHLNLTGNSNGITVLSGIEQIKEQSVYWG